MKNIIKNYNEIEIKKLEKRANKILELEEKYAKLSDFELSEKTYEFQAKLNGDNNLDNILNEAFAVCREASHRILNKKHYKVQLMGGIALHQGRIIEMKTGEGKTLTELCPAYLNALTKNGVHIVTSNEYLAKRDKEEMESLFKFLNISVGLVLEETTDKKFEYAKDIVYSTNTQLGFDYLRDNLVYNIEDKVQRDLNFVIIDEVDSVLIDDARTPLIISEKSEGDGEIYKKITNIVKNFEEQDFYIDEKEESIFLSDDGMKKIEKFFKIKDLTHEKNIGINHIAAQSLRANYLMEKDIDYIVENNEILLIDQNTGRIAEGRVFSDGLQQCIEAKEEIEIKLPMKTLATITYQYFFKLYKKISGMSGTVKTEEIEFREIYDLDVVVLPTNKPIKRIDRIDRVFFNEKTKILNIVNDTIKLNKKGQPILIGTQSIKESEKIAKHLKDKNVKFKILNAKTKKEEAEIIQNAGKIGSIIVATNIAGRGTDIKLAKDALNLGGLKIIGCGRSESLRIDNQLIGRAGRQGEVGESQFYISCEDKILSIYGDNNLQKKVQRNKKKLNEFYEIDYEYAKKFIKDSQKYINSINFKTRKQTVEFDEVINTQRKIIYKERDVILSTSNLGIILSNIILEYIEYILIDLLYNIEVIKVRNKYNLKKIRIAKLKIEEKNLLKLKIKHMFIKDLYIKVSEEVIEEFFDVNFLEEFIENISNFLIEIFNRIFKIKNINEKNIRIICLNTIDFYWKENLTKMEYLKEYVKDQVYNYKNPIDIYRIEGKHLSDDLNKNIKYSIIKNLFNYIINL